MAGRLPGTRIRVVTARRGAVGEEESLETKVGEEESLETKVRRMRVWRLGGRARVSCTKGNNGTPPDLGPGVERFSEPCAKGK